MCSVCVCMYFVCFSCNYLFIVKSIHIGCVDMCTWSCEILILWRPLGHSWNTRYNAILTGPSLHCPVLTLCYFYSIQQRAEQNKMFVYIKIPELKVRLSYKGLKDKNLTDVTNFRLVVPSLEYHNVTWTWLDFLNGLKEHCKSALVPQVSGGLSPSPLPSPHSSPSKPPPSLHHIPLKQDEDLFILQL